MTGSAYPDWVCADCAKPVAKRFPSGDSTSHEGTCDVCGQKKSVTQPRDYGYPDFRSVIEKLSQQKHP